MNKNKYSQDIATKGELGITSHSLPADVGALIQGPGFWSLQTGGAGSANFQAAWAYASGKGVVIGIVDEGVNYRHLDLAGSYSTGLDFDPRDASGSSDAMPDAHDHLHGTQVAGIVAGAVDNTIGSVGAAPGATITASYLRFGSSVDMAELGSVLAQQVRFDVANNSWGFTAAFADNFAQSHFGSMVAEMRNAAENGRDGLGTAMVVAAGNSKMVIGGQNVGDDSNFHNFSNSRYVIAVGAHDSDGNAAFFSSPGTNVLISAPGVGLITTSGASGATDQTSYVSGTSFAAPLVSSAIALMLEVNPDLGYRDIQEILAITARPSNGTGVVTNGASNVNGGGMLFDREVGFGALDAEAAVKLARHWSGGADAANEDHIAGSFALPSSFNGKSQSLQLTIDKPSTGDFSIDFVELSLDIADFDLRDLSIELVSPDGTRSLIAPNLNAAGNRMTLDFTFSSVATWGESPYGTWTLNLRHPSTSEGMVVFDASLDIYGDVTGVNDVYYFTNAYRSLVAADRGRATIGDGDGGTDTLNFAATSGRLIVDLSGATASSLDGARISIAGSFENVVGTTEHDVIAGSGGDNTLTGDDGDDTLDGKAGNDTLNGGDGDDTLIGGAGADALRGGAGTDTADYSTGNGLSINLATGTHSGDAAGDTFSSIERFTLSDSADTFVGGTASDHVQGGGGHDTLVGGAGNDVLDGGTGADTMRGGTGNDTYHVDSTADIVDELSGTGIDTVHATVSIDLANAKNFKGSLENIVLAGNSSLSAAGDQAANTITGNTGDNRLSGRGGNDTLIGGDGDDVLDGGTGGDRLDGGAGNDTASYADATKRVVARLENSAKNKGDAKGDTYDSIENLSGSAKGDKLVGNAAANRLDGLDGNDFLIGEAGNDRLEGGAGDDHLFGGDGSDRLDGGNGNDTVSYADATRGAIVKLADTRKNKGAAKGDTITNVENAVGSSKDDKLIGDKGDNTLDGGDGDDILGGGGGADTLIGGRGDDLLVGGSGSDRLIGKSGRDTVSYAGSNRVVANLSNDSKNKGDAKGDTFASIENLIGSDKSDKLIGDDRDNVLSGGRGTDVLVGGKGADTLIGGKGADTFEFLKLNDSRNAKAGRDTILDFSRAEGDRIDLSAIDADHRRAGDQAFDFIGSAAFSNTRGELRFEKRGGETFVYGDVNGDGRQDFTIVIDDKITLKHTDFVL